MKIELLARGMAAAALVVAASTSAIAQETTRGSTVDVEALYMTRSASPSQPLLSTFAGVGTGNVLNAKDISTGWQPGFQFRLNADVSDKTGIEGGLFFLHPFSDNLGFVAGPHAVEGVTPYSAFSAGTNVEWDSAIYGLEANMTYSPRPGLQLVGGVRHFSIKEDLRFTFPPFPPAGINSNYATTNNLFGPQVGVRGETRELFPGSFDALNIGFDLIGGVLMNSVSSSTFGVGGITPSNARSSKTSLFLRAALDAEYDIAPNATLNVGYQALWIDNIAHVTDQVGTTEVLGAGAFTRIRTNDVLYHGANLKLTVRF